MQDQAQPVSGKPGKPSHSIAQALVALFVLTAVLWIGWWPGLTAGPDTNERTAAFYDSQIITTSADENRHKELELAITIQDPAITVRDNESPASATTPTASAASTAQTTPAGTSQTSAANTSRKSASSMASASESQQMTEASGELFRGIDPDITAHWQFPLKVEPYTPDQGAFGASRTSTRLHAGIDLYAPEGTEVFAMTDGLVSQIYLFYESLLAIEVENDDGTTIRYTELTPLVKVGDRVDQGQLIARLKSNSGGTCMLHLEIYATSGTGPLTQVNNNSYLYVPIFTRSYMRRTDLVDPSAVYTLPPP